MFIATDNNVQDRSMTMFDFSKDYASRKGLVAALRKAEVDLETVTLGQFGEGGKDARWAAKLNHVEVPAPVAPVKKGKSETVRQNGVRFPRVGGLCHQAWMMFDELGQNVDIKTALAEGAKRGFNDNNVRTELCCWRKFYGYAVVRGATKG